MSSASLQASNGELKFEIENHTICIIIPQINYLGMNLTKYINLYEENYKALMKDIKEVNKWGDISHS